jgi:hypothetical protein
MAGAVIVVGMTGIFYLYVNGFFTASGSGYSDLAIPEYVNYNFHVKPILSDKCYACHGPDAKKRKAGLRLDSGESAYGELKEHPGKYAVVPESPEKSELYRRIISRDKDEMMPPPDSKLELNSYEKEIIKKWIEQGAVYEKHWAYIPPVKASITIPTDTGWIQNEIDAFVYRKLRENELRPSPKASLYTLIRRISLDLTGLPPKRAQVQSFIKDRSGEAISKIIDEFLNSDAYGERMTQAWLDVARYADSHGYQDDSYRTMWPWRDWVIHAFNQNLSYDRFLTWQLAGDLLPGATPEQVLATGFNRNHPITQEGGVIQEEYQAAYVVDRTNTFGKAILGITLECAKCHDHKYDPITQKEYYSLYSFFNNVSEKGLQMDAVQAAEARFYADPPYMTISASENRELLDFVDLEKGNRVKVMVMNDSLPRDTYVLNRGNYDDPGEKVEPGTPERIFPFPDSLPANRLGLSEWVTSPNNPLTARVYVNRIWAMLFGNGLVKTAEDFGVQGSLPTYPELLDWLAVDFMEHGWDVKYLLKKIMMSATYQQSSEVSPDLKKADPENKLLARAARFRMNGEMIRDYVLATSGLLNTHIGGPSVKPYQPPGLWEETNAGSKRGILTTYVPDSGEKLYRRSLYTFWKRTLPPPNMTIFDAPSRDFSEVRRQKTNTPLQALALQNDIQVLEATRVMAQNVLSAVPRVADPVREVFELILIRPPSGDEANRLEGYFREVLANFESHPEDAGKLVATGEYRQLDTDPATTAALMLTAQVVYNLDETITKE